MATRTTRPAAKPAPAAAKPSTQAAVKPAAATPPAKPARAVSAKPVSAKPVKASKPAKPAKPAKAEKTDKPKKPKLVRDSFTIPKTEYTAIDALKQRAAKAGAPAKKSELLRAGLMALAAMSDAAFLAAVKSVPTLKTGRPAKS